MRYIFVTLILVGCGKSSYTYDRYCEKTGDCATPTPTPTPKVVRPSHPCDKCERPTPKPFPQFPPPTPKQKQKQHQEVRYVISTDR